MSAEIKPNCIFGNGSCPPNCGLIETAKRLTREQQEGENFMESVALYQAPEIADMCAREREFLDPQIQALLKQVTWF